jgi:cardiolipin synthase
MSARAAQRKQALEAFGRKWQLPEIFSDTIDIVGIRIPVAGIVVVAALTLVAMTIWGIIVSRAPRHITQQLTHQYSVSDSQFLRSMGVLLGPPLVQGNRITTLVNGDEIFPAMLEAIRSAKRTIDFESYIYWSGDIGRQFADALAERARAGVKVHVLLDWFGSHKMDQDYINRMGRAGVEVVRYHQPQWYHVRHVNNRTHRKLLVVDGAVGFTGGVGIADQWTGHAQDADHWRDTHYRIEGPVVAQLQAAFADNWTKMTGEVLHGDAYFPEVKPGGASPAQMFKSSIEGGAESMQLMYMLSLVAAKETIDLSMAYFIPDPLAMDHIVAAIKRGVRVRILLPGSHTDSRLVRAASRSYWGRILEAGGEIYEYQPTMFHCKVLVVDGLWVSAGSTNFDTRSFRLNDEANLNVYDREVARRQVEQFDKDVQSARRITLEEWRGRPLLEKAWDHTVAFFGPQL